MADLTVRLKECEAVIVGKASLNKSMGYDWGEFFETSDDAARGGSVVGRVDLLGKDARREHRRPFLLCLSRRHFCRPHRIHTASWRSMAREVPLPVLSCSPMLPFPLKPQP
ncbi:hypothetical protein M427DRAFT_325223 [Gonapodya prolifera JEL478]|uniref:Uncharacterized protein n=1 Tax=Gonapodya prolifera (strain JEL478) TaxID=1344416 RepID=A0A139AF43_GONPJ|nr:hypothetical protein M427DRAFT_325223 [Gonapodya prolifera JEL478]|eukprot:KXS15442.1 hypothetical protein M427DRAFT_325223 [Gonapodya prolifera JEL478]